MTVATPLDRAALAARVAAEIPAHHPKRRQRVLEAAQEMLAQAYEAGRKDADRSRVVR